MENKFNVWDEVCYFDTHWILFLKIEKIMFCNDSYKYDWQVISNYVNNLKYLYYICESNLCKINDYSVLQKFFDYKNDLFKESLSCFDEKIEELFSLKGYLIKDFNEFKSYFNTLDINTMNDSQFKLAIDKFRSFNLYLYPDLSY